MLCLQLLKEWSRKLNKLSLHFKKKIIQIRKSKYLLWINPSCIRHHHIYLLKLKMYLLFVMSIEINLLWRKYLHNLIIYLKMCSQLILKMNYKNISPHLNYLKIYFQTKISMNKINFCKHEMLLLDWKLEIILL